jgi:hypothetical protein
MFIVTLVVIRVMSMKYDCQSNMNSNETNKTSSDLFFSFEIEGQSTSLVSKHEHHEATVSMKRFHSIEES